MAFHRNVRVNMEISTVKTIHGGHCHVTVDLPQTSKDNHRQPEVQMIQIAVQVFYFGVYIEKVKITKITNLITSIENTE